MGYDSKIYIVEKSRYNTPMNVVIDEEDFGERVWCQVLASMELGVYPAISNFMNAQPETNGYIFADDGNTMVVTDRYGDIMKECSIDELLKVVQKEMDDEVDYRRLSPLYYLLKGYNVDEWDNLRVLHYGH